MTIKSIYLAGVIQGSKNDTDIHNQDYRPRLKKFFEEQLPGIKIYCPVEAHPGSEFYDYHKGEGVFFQHMNWPKDVDMVVAYLPTASMGTAIEMWNAHQSGKIILVISPLKTNWVIKYLSTKIFETIGDFESFISSGGLKVFIA